MHGWVISTRGKLILKWVECSRFSLGFEISRTFLHEKNVGESAGKKIENIAHASCSNIVFPLAIEVKLRKSRNLPWGWVKSNIFYRFQNVAALLVMAIKWIVPRTSRDLRDRMRREAYVTNEIIIRTELLKAQGKLNFFKDTQNGASSPNTVDEEIEVNLWEKNEETIPLRKRSSDTNTGDVTDGRIVM